MMEGIDFENINNRIQYSSIEGAIEAHAKTYSFNIDSELFPQLTEKQQKLWRKEIEQACISGGNSGIELAKDSHVIDGVKWQKTKDESTTEDLDEYINELSKWFPEVSFAKLNKIAVKVSRWQRNQDTKNKLPKVINKTDLDEYAYQCAYDMSNDWMIENPTWHDVEDACKLGANWQKQQDYAYFAGRTKTIDENKESTTIRNLSL